MRNNTWKPFAITLIVVCTLLGMFYLPRIQVGDKLLRRVNILSEIQRRDSDGKILAEIDADRAEGIVEQKFDSAATRVRKTAFVDSIPDGMTAIEDFSDGDAPIMDLFYSALDEAQSRPVRIAYYGDSYIEGDILTEDLREYLQRAYGGCGVGFVDIHSITAGFRQTVRVKSEGWSDHNANDHGKAFDKSFQGINGRYFISSNGTMELKGQNRKYGSHLDTMQMATIYFTPGPGLTISSAINDDEMSELFATGGEATYEERTYTVQDRHITATYNDDSTEVQYDTTYTSREVHTSVGHQEQGHISHKSVKGRIGKFTFNVSGGGSSRFYGVALDGTKGITLDNFSMRGSNGWYIKDIPTTTLQAFKKIRPYDLVILHFGLNTASRTQKDYSGYTKRMRKTISHIRHAFPEAALLVISLADREERDSEGNMRTMSGVRELISYQRKMASDEKVAFWNLYEAMGGEGSIARMVEAKQANLDYTHINFAGGKHLAKILFDVLQNGKKNYDRRK